MKKSMVGVLVLVGLFAASLPATDDAQDCATIQSGTLTNSAGGTLTVGYDDRGYNYQGRIFNGDGLEMKWNDVWLSNKDCDGDGKLDRHRGFPSYLGSGAWLTNHQEGTYFEGGKRQHWNYFVKIVAAPLDATAIGGMWYATDGSEIGPSIWGEFAIVQDVYNDTGTGDHGVLYLSPYSAGFGKFSPKR